MTPRHITLILPSLRGGGAERVAVNLAHGFVERGIRVQMVLLERDENRHYDVDERVEVIGLGHGRALSALFDLRVYFRDNQPDAVISFLNQTNLVVLLAHWLAGSRVPVIATVHSGLDRAKRESRKDAVIVLLFRFVIGRAARMVGVSKGVTASIRDCLGTDNVETIYNPVIMPDLPVKMQATLNHPWFTDNEGSVIVAAGRLQVVKGFDVLIRAFAQLRETHPARLMILGEGPLRGELEALVDSLGIQDVVQMPGFVGNPYAYFARADAFALSSRHEGLPTVLIEAMACGCPVVATDAPGGSREILDGGKYGPLVPVEDAGALAQALVGTLANPLPAGMLKTRADDFSIKNSVDHYLRIIEEAKG